MSRNYLADYNLLAVSDLAKETAINTEQTLGHTFLIDKKDVPSLDPRVEDNRDEATGKEEPDIVYRLGNLASFSPNFNKAQAQHFAFGLAYALGTISNSAWGTGYKHLITPTSGMDLPGFTAGFRAGLTIYKRRFASLYVDKLTATFAKDSWAKLVLGLKGTGKFTDNMTQESVTAAYNATSLTLAANAVQGSDAATRLDNVHSIRVQVPSTLEWVDVVYSVVSGATPAVITIVAPGVPATSTTYKILYVPAEAAWATFPARIDEPPMRVTDLTMKLGGLWNGSTFLGGHTIDFEIESVEYALDNQMEIAFRPGGTGTYANFARRQGRIQTLTLNRQARDFLLQQKMVDNEYFGVYLKATGAEFETGKNYYVELIFPRCNLLRAPISIGNKDIIEAGTLQVLQDDTYGSVRAEVANMIATYAA